MRPIGSSVTCFVQPPRLVRARQEIRGDHLRLRPRAGALRLGADLDALRQLRARHDQGKHLFEGGQDHRAPPKVHMEDLQGNQHRHRLPGREHLDLLDVDSLQPVQEWADLPLHPAGDHDGLREGDRHADRGDQRRVHQRPGEAQNHQELLFFE